MGTLKHVNGKPVWPHMAEASWRSRELFEEAPKNEARPGDVKQATKAVAKPSTSKRTSPVTVVQAPPIENELVNGTVVLPRSWGKVAKTSVVVPVDALVDGRVPADIRGVTCDVDTHGETTLSVRVSGPVLKDEATCVLPKEDGSSYAIAVELPRGI